MCRNPLGVFTVTVHSHCKRLDAAQDHEAIEGAGYRTDCILVKGKPLGDLRVIRDDRTANYIGVTAQVFGGRVLNDVRTDLKRSLQLVRGKRAVHCHQDLRISGLGQP